MKKILFAILLLAATINVHSQTHYPDSEWDFYSVCSTGQPLYYIITSDSTVKVTYPGNKGGESICTGVYEQHNTITADYYQYYWQYCIDVRPGGLWCCHDAGEIYARPSGKLRIPDTVVYNNHIYKVTAINSFSFRDCVGIDSLYIGCNIETIGTTAFGNCSGIRYLYFNAKKCSISTSSGIFGANDSLLTTLVIGDSVEVIPGYAFKNCSHLTSVALPNSINKIESGAFYECSGLAAMIIPPSVRYIGSDAFRGCSGLATVVIPPSVDTIGYRAFKRCSRLTTITIPPSVRQIGSDAFDGCTSIVTVDFNAESCNTFTSNKGFFINCSNLTTINIGNNVKRIPYKAFSGCSNLSNVAFGDSVMYIRDSAFAYCSSISHIDLPYHIVSIGKGAFWECTNLSFLHVPWSVSSIGNNAFWHVGSICYNGSATGIPWGAHSVVTCPDTVGLIYSDSTKTVVVDYVGPDTVVVIPESVIEIGPSAFENCSHLCVVSIPNTVRTIGNRAFYGCVRIKDIVLPDSLLSIGEKAFYGCDSISSIYIPEKVSSIGKYAYAGCKRVSSIVVNQRNPYYDSRDSCNAIIETTTNTLLQGCNSTIVPTTISHIGSWAFYGCEGLEFIVIPNTIDSIHERTFMGCSSLHAVVIPDSVVYIGQMAFSGCGNIQSLSIGSSVDSIALDAFMGCDSIDTLSYNSPYVTFFKDYLSDQSQQHISRLVVGDNVQVIPAYAFNEFASLRYVEIGNGVVSVGNNAFFNDNNIDSIFIGSSVHTIGANAFYGCSGLKYLYYNAKNCNNNDDSPLFPNTPTDMFNTLVIGDSVGNIPNRYFMNRTSLHCVTIPDGVVNIGSYAFSGCNGIDSLYLGSGTQSIGAGAFLGCSGLKYIYYNARNCNDALFDTSANAPFYNTSTALFNLLVIGDSVRVIPNNAFYNKSSVCNILIGSNVLTIGNGAFMDCSGFGKLVIPESVTNVGGNAFKGCTGIDTLYIGSGVQSIEAKTFSGCTNIKYIFYNARNCNALFATGATSPFYNTNTSLFSTLVIGDSVEYIPNYAFFNRSSINNVQIGASVRNIGNNAFQGCSGIYQLIIPNNVTSIGNNAFYGCSGIVSLHIVNGITTIGSGVFQGCSGFTKLVIPQSVTSIGSNAFYGCTGIDSLYIGSSVQTIGSGAFYGCTGLQWLNYNAPNLPAQGFYGCTQLATLILGNTVQSIGDNAFYNCDNLLMATVNAHQIGNNAFANCDRLVSVTLGDSVMTLGSSAFNGCFRLQNINLGGVTTVGDNAFNGCVRLENPELPAGLATIGAGAFQGCSLLAGKLTFPATITRIGDYAYSNIGTVTGVDMLGATPPSIYSHTFASVSNSTPVSVPCGAVMSYYTTDYWENFSNIVEAPPYRLTVQSNNATMGSAAITQQPTCSNHSAIIQATALSGFHFLEWNDGNGTNPRTIQMTQDSTFTAVFVPNNSYIVVEPNDPTMGATSGTGTYGYNAPITMTATAYSGYHFLRWNDGNTQNPRYLAATRDSTFTAIFVSNVSTLTVANANPEMGNVSGSGVYYYQNLVSITATPNYGYHFTQWNDGNTQNPRTITISQDTAFTAYFALNTYSIIGSSNSTTMGSVTGGGVYTYLHSMSLTATPAYGYHFVQWNDQVTDNPRTITVTRDSAFTAQFAANSYSITAVPNDPSMGSVYGSGTYNYNTTATLTAVETYGYHFTQWSDGVTSNPRVVTVQNNATYTAQFAINSYVLTVQSSNPAIGTTSGGGSYSYLTPVTITALPNVGYHFTQWSDGNTENPRLVSVVQNATYTAQFAINSYAVGVTSNNTSMGSVNGSGTYNYNSTATLSATAYYGYHFVQWQDGNTQNPRTVVVTDSAQFTAQFDYNSYLITANSSNVTLGTATGGGSYNYLSQVALTAVPAPHYHFTMWNDSIEDNPRTVTVTRDSLFTAHFAIDRHTIGVNSADAVRGSVGGSDTVDYNTPVWISATANYGYHFTQWNDGNSSNPRRVVVTQDRVYTASFAPNQYSAACAVNDNTRGTVASTGGSYNYLTQLTFTAIPNTDYHFLRWSNGSTDNPITFTLTKDTVLTAILVGLTANVNDSTMGTVSHIKQSNLVEVVTATPNYGYHFVQWNDGNTDNPRTMNLVSDTSVTAVFAINTYVVSVVSNDSTLGSVLGGGGYNYLSQVTITATAAPHSHFVHWNDGNTTNPRLLTLTRDTSFTAIFESDLQYQIVVDANDFTMGSVSGSGMYYIGETATIIATANEHYYFAQWSDGNTSNPRLVTVLGNATYTAVFEPVTYTVTVEANDYTMGQVVGGGSYAYGATVTIEARAFGGYRFAGWNDGVQDRQRTIAVISDTSFTATFDSNVGIDEVTNLSYGISIRDRHIIVEGVENDRVRIFDVTGRQHQPSEALPSGIYMVQIGNWSKKVLVL